MEWQLASLHWSGRAPAPPAIEAGKGRQRRGARYVRQTQFCNRGDWYRYIQLNVRIRGSAATAWSLATQRKQVAMVRGWGFSKR
jgi:hypothetical protein